MENNKKQSKMLKIDLEDHTILARHSKIQKRSLKNTFKVILEKYDADYHNTKLHTNQ